MDNLESEYSPHSPLPRKVEQGVLIAVIGAIALFFSFFGVGPVGVVLRFGAGVCGVVVLTSVRRGNVRGVSGVDWTLCWVLYLYAIVLAFFLIVGAVAASW
jgi:hypothetical protein